MSRNSRKFQKQNNPRQTKSEVTKDNIKDNILSKLSFVASTERVELPTKGLFYSKSSPLFGVEHVELKHMTAKEEDIMSSMDADNSKELLIRIVQSILIKPNVDASLFCEQDLTAILLNARKTGYGNTFTTSEFCLGCSSITKFEFDLSKQSVVEPNKEKVKYNSEDDTLEMELPTLEMKVKARMLTDQDVKAMEIEKQKKEELGLEFNKTTSFLKSTIVSVENIPDKSLINKLIDTMPAADAIFFKEMYTDFRPKISTMQEVACQSCGAINRKEVPGTWAFFRPDQSIH